MIAYTKKVMADPYSPNIFVRIGFFLLTAIALACGLGLLFLIITAGDKGMAWAAICYAIGITVLLEYMISQKRHFRSGVDDALLWSAAGLLYYAIGEISGGGSYTGAWVLALLILTAGALRYGDSLMTLGCYISLGGILYTTNSLVLIPYTLIALSAIMRVVSVNLKSENYAHCLMLVSIASLLGMYAAGNVYIVKEMIGAARPIWFFWIWTIAVPVIYGYLGIKRKDRILVRACLILIAATVFTVRYYYHFLEIEYMLTIGGIALIAASSLLIRYLKQPRNGITSLEDKDQNSFGRKQVEAIIVATTFSADSPGAGPEGTQFGGGSGGGGGASGTF